jgi:hypothetical protein
MGYCDGLLHKWSYDQILLSPIFIACICKSEDYDLLGCGAMQSGRVRPMFQRNVLPPPSGKKSMLVWKKCYQYHEKESQDQALGELARVG